jgi:hypothetical protein
MLYMIHILSYYMHFYFAILLYNLHNLILYILVLIFPTTCIYIYICMYVWLIQICSDMDDMENQTAAIHMEDLLYFLAKVTVN